VPFGLSLKEGGTVDSVVVERFSGTSVNAYAVKRVSVKGCLMIGLSLKERGGFKSSMKKGIANNFGLPHKLIKFSTKERRSIYAKIINRAGGFYNRKGPGLTPHSS